jgi:hypothetical protein
MSGISQDLIAHHFDRAVAAQRASWSMAEGESRKLDLVNHVLRVILQLRRLEGYVDEFEALAMTDLGFVEGENADGLVESVRTVLAREVATG